MATKRQQLQWQGRLLRLREAEVLPDLLSAGQVPHDQREGHQQGAGGDQGPGVPGEDEVRVLAELQLGPDNAKQDDDANDMWLTGSQ